MRIIAEVFHRGLVLLEQKVSNIDVNIENSNRDDRQRTATYNLSCTISGWQDDRDNCCKNNWCEPNNSDETPQKFCSPNSFLWLGAL